VSSDHVIDRYETSDIARSHVAMDCDVNAPMGFRYGHSIAPIVEVEVANQSRL